MQIMAQAEQLCRLVAQRQALVEAAPQVDWSGAMAALQDRAAALSAAILDAEAHISTVLQQKRDGQANRGASIIQRYILILQFVLLHVCFLVAGKEEKAR